MMREIAGKREVESKGADPVREGERAKEKDGERGDRRCQHRHCGWGPAGPSGGLIIGLGFYT